MMEKTAYHVAIRLLSRREHSHKELIEKLQQRQFDMDDISDALTKVIEENYLCDERFTESYVRHRSNRNFGPIRIKQELYQRGIEDSMIERWLNKHDWFEIAQNLFDKKFSPPETLPEKLKQKQFLQYRGFTAEQISSLYND